jgi:hypothetical protein
MERQSALVLTIIFFVIFTAIVYYGARATSWGSIVFGTFTAFILLNVFYPPSQATSDNADFTLVIYAILEITAIIILAIYIIQKTLGDTRCVN